MGPNIWTMSIVSQFFQVSALRDAGIAGIDIFYLLTSYELLFINTSEVFLVVICPKQVGRLGG